MKINYREATCVSEIQRSFDEALHDTYEHVPRRFYEGYPGLIGVGGVALVAAEIAALTTEAPTPLEYAIAFATYAAGTIADRASTFRIIRRNNQLEKYGIDSPYAESNPWVNTETPRKFMTDPRALAIDAAFAGATFLTPIGGFTYGAMKIAMAKNNWRKARRLKLAAAYSDPAHDLQ